jgi:hypothetical protein
MKLKLKPIVLAAALALSSASIYAENISFNVPLTGPAGNVYTAGFEVRHVVAGAFEDTFTFTPEVAGFLHGSLVTTGANTFDNINFTSASINGIAFDFSPTGINEWGFTNVAFSSGPIILKLFGIAAPDLAPGTAIAASYAGTLNISAVPEPATYAMMLGGLGLVGFVARRRKKKESSSGPSLAAC